MPRHVLSCVLFALLAGPAAAQEPAAKAPPFSHREFRGPEGGPAEKSTFAHLTQVAFSRDGTKMAAGAGAEVHVWNVADGSELVRMQLPGPQIYHRLAFDAAGKTLVWCGREDPLIRVWDVATGRQLREFRQPNGNTRGTFSSYFLAFSPDGARMAFTGPAASKGLDVFDVATGKLVTRIAGQEDCRGCAFSPDGKLLAAHSSSAGVRLWDARTGKLVRVLRPEGRYPNGAFTLAVFSPDGKLLGTAGHTKPGLDVWDVATGALVCTVESKFHFQGASFAADGESVTYVGAGSRAALYHLVAEKETHAFHPPDGAHFVAFAPDGKRLAIIGNATAQGRQVRQEAVYVYDLPAAALAPAAAAVDDAALEELWAGLDTDNDFRRKRFTQALRAAPQPAVALFKKKLPPLPKAEQARVEGLVGALGDPAFKKRDKATKELQSVAHQFAPLLETRLRQADPGEVRNRLAFVIGQAKDEPTPRPLVVQARVLALLEQIGTRDARELLQQLADGAPQARLSVDARAALERIGREPAKEK